MYSMDYKKRAVAYKDGGHTFEQLKEAFGIPNQTSTVGNKIFKAGTMKQKANRNVNVR